MTLIKTEEITENGLTYIVNTYDNGTVEKYIKPDPDAVTPEPEPQDPPITNNDLAEKIDALFNVQRGHTECIGNVNIQIGTVDPNKAKVNIKLQTASGVIPLYSYSITETVLSIVFVKEPTETVYVDWEIIE